MLRLPWRYSSVVSVLVIILIWNGCKGQLQEEVDSKEEVKVLSSFSDSLSNAAIELTFDQVVYDPSYYSIDYPNGDVPSGVGVCTDVVIRAYRKLGIDLQVLVHEDMKTNFDSYPKNWGLTRTDRNIDHRRVPNLRRYFERKSASIPVSQNPEDYLPGDLVTWMLSGNLPHIGIVIDKYEDGSPLIVHNIGAGQVIQNCLFDYEITGHYRFKP